MKNKNRLDGREDYQMIDRAAGVAFSNLQRPVVPAWVNKDPITGDTRYWPVEPEPETFNGLSAENWEYVMQLEEEAATLRTTVTILAAAVIGMTLIVLAMYETGLIIH